MSSVNARKRKRDASTKPSQPAKLSRPSHVYSSLPPVRLGSSQLPANSDPYSIQSSPEKPRGSSRLSLSVEPGKAKAAGLSGAGALKSRINEYAPSSSHWIRRSTRRTTTTVKTPSKRTGVQPQRETLPSAVTTDSTPILSSVDGVAKATPRTQSIADSRSSPVSTQRQTRSSRNKELVEPSDWSLTIEDCLVKGRRRSRKSLKYSSNDAMVPAANCLETNIDGDAVSDVRGQDATIEPQRRSLDPEQNITMEDVAEEIDAPQAPCTDQLMGSSEELSQSSSSIGYRENQPSTTEEAETIHSRTTSARRIGNVYIPVEPTGANDFQNGPMEVKDSNEAANNRSVDNLNAGEHGYEQLAQHDPQLGDDIETVASGEENANSDLEHQEEGHGEGLIVSPSENAGEGQDEDRIVDRSGKSIDREEIAAILQGMKDIEGGSKPFKCGSHKPELPEGGPVQKLVGLVAETQAIYDTLNQTSQDQPEISSRIPQLLKGIGSCVDEIDEEDDRDGSNWIFNVYAYGIPALIRLLDPALVHKEQAPPEDTARLKQVIKLLNLLLSLYENAPQWEVRESLRDTAVVQSVNIAIGRIRYMNKALGNELERKQADARANAAMDELEKGKREWEMEIARLQSENRRLVEHQRQGLIRAVNNEAKAPDRTQQGQSRDSFRASIEVRVPQRDDQGDYDDLGQESMISEEPGEWQGSEMYALIEGLEQFTGKLD